MSEPGQHCIEIERPADAVFNFAAGLHNAPHWLSGVLEVSALGAAGLSGARGPRPGGRYLARLRLPGGARRLRFRVEALMPGELLVLQAEASLPLRLLLLVRPSSARRTRVCWRCELPVGRPERALLAVLRGAAESRYAHRSLQRLKLLLEVAPAMRAAQLRRFGPPSEVLEIAEAPLPEPRPREVLVRVAASSVNPADLARMEGRGPRLWGRARLPVIPGRDLSGVVVAAGARVRRFQVGDEVWGTAPGAWAEFAAVAESALAPKPKSLSDTEAAALLAARLRGRGRWAFRPSGVALAKIGRLVEEQRIRPLVDRVLPLAQAGEAAAHVALRRAQGEVVLWIERGGPAWGRLAAGGGAR